MGGMGSQLPSWLAARSGLNYGGILSKEGASNNTQVKESIPLWWGMTYTEC